MQTLKKDLQQLKISQKVSARRAILSSIERHLSRSSYGKTIFKDSDFKKTK